ncbi:hypothetical protein HPO96_27880 [Kribbella sandramycini]|uniref:Uncharacterized protein n=1 Tax=Kribbella sandramycini TaxID=60450 RepID=A0A7Y4P3G1_9ACTN|nr:hypothetical protein [Kribbella sandramycini]MBB6570945.1 hypothetical protein [Kribbella sandramycini]NOL44075.1 hypothetical protein [Kribbella sandramycini]
MTEHPGEQFPPDVDPDVEPDYAPDGEETPAQPDYDAEPAPESFGYAEASQEHLDPAEVEFGPEFAREPGQQHERPFVAESADEESESGHPLVEEVMGRLDDLRERPVGEHAEVYADLHERLQTALVEADSDQSDSR